MPCSRPRWALGPLGLHHPREGGGKRRERDGLARRVERAVGLQPEPLVLRPRLHEPEVRLDGAGGEGPQREPLPGVLDGAGRDLLEAHGAPALQHRQGAVEGARHHRGVEALAEEIAPARLVPLDAGALRGPALGDDGGDLALRGRVDENERLSPQPVEVLLDDPAHEERGHARIERVAALDQRLERGRGGERMARRQPRPRAGYGRALCLQRRGRKGHGQSGQNEVSGERAAAQVVQHLDPQSIRPCTKAKTPTESLCRAPSGESPKRTRRVQSATAVSRAVPIAADWWRPCWPQLRRPLRPTAMRCRLRPDARRFRDAIPASSRARLSAPIRIPGATHRRSASSCSRYRFSRRSTAARKPSGSTNVSGW